MAEQKKDIQKSEQTVSERFVEKVRQEFEGAVGHGVAFTSYEKQLASNLYIHIDTSLKAFEAKRLKDKDNNKLAFIWSNIDMQELAVNAVHRIRLGLDALIPNHIHTIPYFNSKTGKYNLDLQIGYKGKDYYRRKMAVTQPKDIRYELIYDGDHFKALPKDGKRNVESYEFEIPDPWNREKVIGAFGYIIYSDPERNKLVIVKEKDFKKIEAKAKASNFWREWPDKMRYKTLVHRTTDHLEIDPEKVNPSFHIVEEQDSIFREPERQQIDVSINRGEEEPENTNTETEEPSQSEKQEENGNGNGTGVALEYKSNLLECRTIEEVEELRAIARKSFTDKKMSKGDLKAITDACDDRVEKIKGDGQ